MGQKKSVATLYKLPKMKKERMTSMVTRRMVVGTNEMLGYLYIKKGAIGARHKHVSEQITVILKGVERMTVNDDEVYVLRPGDILVIPPNVEHAGEALEETIEMNCFSPLREDWLKGELTYLVEPNPKKPARRAKT